MRLGRLERAHLITREPDPENRRSVTVTLTERGAALVRAARPAYAARTAGLAAGVSAAAISSPAPADHRSVRSAIWSARCGRRRGGR